MPGLGGINTFFIPRSFATSIACNGPAPPNAKRENFEGSCPRSTDIALIAFTITEEATCTIPSAVSSLLILNFSAKLSIASSARSLRIVILPSSSEVSGSRPNITFASVTVAKTPPLL